MNLVRFKRSISGGITGSLLLIWLVAPAIARDLNESNLDRHGYYTNSVGHEVHQPAKSLNGTVPPGASARCRDGDYSFSEHHSGTCSGHGGVATWVGSAPDQR